MRFVAAFILGSVIALSLFWAMQYMITNNQHGLKKTDNIVMSEFVRLKRETRLQTKKRPAPEKPKPKARPTPPKMHMQQAHIKQVTPTNINMPHLDIPLQRAAFKGSVLVGQQMQGTGHYNSGTMDSQVIPLVRIPPIYPRRAANRRIQGWVKLEFTITSEGGVSAAKVVDAKPSTIFNRAALQAIKRWKFKPLMVDGQAHAQRAMQTLEFKLAK